MASNNNNRFRLCGVGTYDDDDVVCSINPSKTINEHIIISFGSNKEQPEKTTNWINNKQKNNYTQKKPTSRPLIRENIICFPS